MCLDLINVLIEKPERELHATLGSESGHARMKHYTNIRTNVLMGEKMTRTASYTRQEVTGSERGHAQWSITQKFEQTFLMKNHDENG